MSCRTIRHQSKRAFFVSALPSASARAHISRPAITRRLATTLLSVSLDWRSVDVMNQVLEKLSDQVVIAVRQDRAIRRHLILDNTLKLIMSLEGYLNSIRPIEKNASRIYYNAAVASAIALRAASVLADDPPDRKILLIKAMDRLLALQGGEMKALSPGPTGDPEPDQVENPRPGRPRFHGSQSAQPWHSPITISATTKPPAALFLPLFARHAIGPKFKAPGRRRPDQRQRQRSVLGSGLCDDERSP